MIKNNPFGRLQIMLSLLLLSVVAVAQTDDSNKAQRWSLSSPWGGQFDNSGWQFDFRVSGEAEGTFGSDGVAPLAPFSQSLGSESSNDFAGWARALYQDQGGRRYFVSGGNESASAGVWWPFEGNWLLGMTISYEETAEFINEDQQNIFVRTVFPQESLLEGRLTVARGWDEFTVAGAITTDLRSSRGIAGGLEGRWDKFLTDKFRVAAIADVTFGDSTNLFADFGVAPGQAGASGLRVYDPGAGLRSSKFSVELEYYLTNQWALFSDIGTTYFYSNAGDSPRLGGPGSEGAEIANYAIGIGARYRWDR